MVRPTLQPVWSPDNNLNLKEYLSLSLFAQKRVLLKDSLILPHFLYNFILCSHFPHDSSVTNKVHMEMNKIVAIGTSFIPHEIVIEILKKAPATSLYYVLGASRNPFAPIYQNRYSLKHIKKLRGSIPCKVPVIKLRQL